MFLTLTLPGREQGGFNVPAFLAPAPLHGHEATLIAAVAAALNAQFASETVVFTSQEPVGGSYTTVFIGGDNSAFADYGSFYGLAEKVDSANQIGLTLRLYLAMHCIEGQAPRTSLPD